MKWIKSAAFNWDVLLKRSAACAYLLMALGSVSGQTIHVEDEEAAIPLDALPLDTILEETSEFEWLLDRLWTLHPAVQTVWGWQSDGIRPSHLGGRNQWQLRISAKSGPWQTGLIADKDMGEPWGMGATPWKGPELKRWFLERTGHRVHLLGGGIRIQHGFGLVSGRRPNSMPSLSNPLRLPGKLASTRGYAGSAGGPVRSGLLIGLEGRFGAIRMWQSADRVPASTSLDRTSDASGQTVIEDLSGTSAFVTENSLIRRNAVRLSSSGIQSAIAGRIWQFAVMGEHVRLDASDPNLNTSVAISHLPSSVFAGSLAGMLSIGAFRMVAENALAGRGMSSWRTALRWKHANTSGLILDIAHTNQDVASPYSGRTRLFVDHDSEFTLRTAARWRRSKVSDWRIRGVIRRRVLPEGMDATQRLALDWIGGGGAEGGLRIQAGLTWQVAKRPDNNQESISRLNLRLNQGDANTWGAGLQLSAGLRRDWFGEQGLTGLAGVTVQRRAFEATRSRPSESGGTELDQAGLDEIGLHESRVRPTRKAMPEWTALILVRRSSDVRTILYATQPNVSGGFPVLSGSSNILVIINRLRWKPNPSWQSDVLVRLDRRSSEQPKQYSLRFTFQLRVAL